MPSPPQVPYTGPGPDWWLLAAVVLTAVVLVTAWCWWRFRRARGLALAASAVVAVLADAADPRADPCADADDVLVPHAVDPDSGLSLTPQAPNSASASTPVEVQGAVTGQPVGLRTAGKPGALATAQPPPRAGGPAGPISTSVPRPPLTLSDLAEAIAERKRDETDPDVAAAVAAGQRIRPSGGPYKVGWTGSPAGVYAPGAHGPVRQGAASGNGVHVTCRGAHDRGEPAWVCVWCRPRLEEQDRLDHQDRRVTHG